MLVSPPPQEYCVYCKMLSYPGNVDLRRHLRMFILSCCDHNYIYDARYFAYYCKVCSPSCILMYACKLIRWIDSNSSYTVTPPPPTDRAEDFVVLSLAWFRLGWRKTYPSTDSIKLVPDDWLTARQARCWYIPHVWKSLGICVLQHRYVLKCLALS